MRTDCAGERGPENGPETGDPPGRRRAEVRSGDPPGVAGEAGDGGDMKVRPGSANALRKEGEVVGRL